MAQLIANYIEALGTLAAVVLALFLQVFLVRRKRPGFWVEYSADPTEEDIRNLDRDSFSEHWERFRVHTYRRKHAAKNTEIFVTKVRRPPSPTPREAVPAGNLEWSDAGVSSCNIPSGTWRRSDILCYWHGDSASEPALSVVIHSPTTPSPPPMPLSERHILRDIGSYAIEFYISCDEADPVKYQMTFNHLGVSKDYVPGRRMSAEQLGRRIANVQFHKVT
jgi:hypothetical protein